MALVEPISHAQLRKLPLFAELSEDALAWFIEAGQVRELRPREVYRSKDAAEGFVFVLRGVVAIVLGSSAQSAKEASPKGSKRLSKDQQFLGYFELGACFSNAFSQSPPGDDEARVDCVAVNSVLVLELDSRRLRPLLERQPDLKRNLERTIALSRRDFLAHQDPLRRKVQDFFLRENYVTSSVVRVGRLDLCIDCNKCYDACATRHGHARMNRLGPTLGRLAFPVVCRTCEDRPCIAACKYDAIAFNEARSEVQIGQGCIGCGLCAKRCPNDAIVMVPLPERNDGARGPKQRAVKCDHCAEYDDRACMTACPTGALIEIQPSELFRETVSDPSGAPRSFSENSFINGLSAPNAVARRVDQLKNWAIAVTLLVVAWLGIESFLIATQPERSALEHFVRATGLTFPVQYSSGRGIGHWFGYIGTAMMLASVVYTLRRRLTSWQGYGNKATWLSAHLWFGFVGAALVTYHAAFKLDRWASIALYLMWLVVLTGAIGRYVYGRVNSTIGVVEFELGALRSRCARYVESCPPHWAIRVLAGPESSDARSRWLVAVLLWEELRDRFALLWLRVFRIGAETLGDERKAMLHGLADLASLRRRRSYSVGTQAALRHWSIIHIVLTILMFLLAGFHVVYGFIYKAV